MSSSAQHQSPYVLVSQFVTHLNGVLSAIDIYQLPDGERKIVTDLRQQLAESRLDVRDYELSETREQQLANAATAKKRLTKVRKDILAASEYNIFSSIDVAHLTANIEQIIERLE